MEWQKNLKLSEENKTTPTCLLAFGFHQNTKTEMENTL